MNLYFASIAASDGIAYAAVIAAESRDQVETLAREDSSNHFDDIEISAIETPVAEGVIAAIG